MAGYKKARKQPSVMAHNFGQVPRADIPRSTFNLSHGVKTVFDADLLIPMGVWDVIPGDSWNVKTTVLARLATPLHPLMDNIYIDTFYFFVPYRILWDNFEKFMGAQHDPADTIDFTIPIISGAQDVDLNDVSDYMGLPLGVVANDVDITALPFRAMYLIWNDWFRDENLQDSLDIDIGNGPDTNADIGWSEPCLRRAKKHDYFTSALPWPQKQTLGVTLPLGTTAPIVGLGLHTGIAAGVGAIATRETGGTDEVYAFEADSSTDFIAMEMSSAHVSTGYPLVFADLTNATSATINELRLAFQTQKLLERDARGGTRYVETLKAHWGVTFPDYTAQRPVYLGGGSIPMGIHPVAQTTPNPTTPTVKDQQGGLAGYGEAVGQSGFTKSFVEHGVIIALVNARGDITYSQGIDRYWSKATRYDFYYPILSSIGEQSILNKEIWNTVGSSQTANDGVFGYTGRYNEYRFQTSRLTSLMRPDPSGTLASWNLSEDFGSLPTLGSTFIESNTRVPLDRAIAVPAEPQFICDIWHDIKTARPLPLYGVPGQGMNF